MTVTTTLRRPPDVVGLSSSCAEIKIFDTHFLFDMSTLIASDRMYYKREIIRIALKLGFYMEKTVLRLEDGEGNNTIIDWEDFSREVASNYTHMWVNFSTTSNTFDICMTNYAGTSIPNEALTTPTFYCGAKRWWE